MRKVVSALFYIGLALIGVGVILGGASYLWGSLYVDSPSTDVAFSTMESLLVHTGLVLGILISMVGVASILLSAIALALRKIVILNRK